MTEQLETQMRRLLVGRFRVASAAYGRRTQRGNGKGGSEASSLSVMAPPGRARRWPSGTNSSPSLNVVSPLQRKATTSDDFAQRLHVVDQVLRAAREIGHRGRIHVDAKIVIEGREDFLECDGPFLGVFAQAVRCADD